jgi:hypothetical protein
VSKPQYMEFTVTFAGGKREPVVGAGTRRSYSIDDGVLTVVWYGDDNKTTTTRYSPYAWESVESIEQLKTGGATIIRR